MVKEFIKKKLMIFIIIGVLLSYFLVMIAAFGVLKQDLRKAAIVQVEYSESLEITPRGITGTVDLNNGETSDPEVEEEETPTEGSQERISKIISNRSRQRTIKMASTDTPKQTEAAEEKNKSSRETISKLVEDLVKDMDFLKKYIQDDEDGTIAQKMEYLLNAEAVCRFPYIEAIAEDETALNGIIKFNRYTTQIDDGDEVKEYQLTYIEEEEFENKFENYKNSGNTDVFKYFTINEEQDVIIAGGRVTTSTITTDDADVNLDTINEVSIENYSKNDNGTYSYSKYDATKQEIEYQSLVEQYILPFNFYATVLIQTKDYELAKELASLAYESEIIIGIYDNKSTSIITNKYEYSKKLQYTESTTLNFSNTGLNIWESRFNSVIKHCHGEILTSGGQVVGVRHLRSEEDPNSPEGGVPADHGELYTAYISGLSEDGLITSIQDTPHTFTTENIVEIVSNTSSTKGVILADIWAGKWETTYIPEYNELQPTGSTTDREDSEVQLAKKANFSEDVYNNKIVPVLSTHSNALKENAVNKIVEIAKNTGMFTQATREITIEDIRNHIGTCEDCNDILKSFYHASWGTDGRNITDETLLNNVKSNSRLKDVETHVQDEINRQAENANENKIDEFESNLRNKIDYDQYVEGRRNNIGIKYTTGTEPYITKYEKDLTETTDIGVKFKKILNRAKFHDTKQSILDRKGWFWDAIKQNEDTAKLENVLRYLFNIAYDTDYFGKFTSQDIEELFKLFEPKELEMNSAGTSNLALLREYVRSWEHESMLNYINGKSSYTEYISQFISEDKKTYYIQTDGNGHPTVGFGVDIFNGGFVSDFAEFGYSTEIGTPVPVEFVDSLEERELKQNLEDVRNRTSELNLKPYQIYALVSRAYNCGIDGALETFNALSFVEAYTQYYNPEEDDKHGETLEDFSHELYTKYMHIPIKSDGVVLQGLIDRRKSEWILFQTGYMDRIGKWCGAGNYPDGIRTFNSAGYTFPEYPQTSTVGDTSLYAGERYGNPTYGKTLGSSGCGTFSLAVILSGLLNDASIDPITVRDTIEKEFGYSYYVYDPDPNKRGSSHIIYNDDFLYENYGVHSRSCNGYEDGIKALEEGKCIIGHDKGHLLAIIPVPDEYKGSGYEFFVIDSARGDTGAYSSVDDFLARTGESTFGFNYIISF